MRGMVASVLLGSAPFVERMRSWLKGRLPDREVPATRELRRAVGVAAVERAVCAVFEVTAATLPERRRWRNEAKQATG